MKGSTIKVHVNWKTPQKHYNHVDIRKCAENASNLKTQISVISLTVTRKINTYVQIRKKLP